MFIDHNDGNVTTIERGKYGEIIKETYGEYDYSTYLGSVQALNDLAHRLGWRVSYSHNSTCVSVYQNSENGGYSAFCLCSSDTPTLENVKQCIQFIQQIGDHASS